jgi:hypothetical protein
MRPVSAALARSVNISLQRLPLGAFVVQGDAVRFFITGGFRNFRDGNTTAELGGDRGAGGRL